MGPDDGLRSQKLVAPNDGAISLTWVNTAQGTMTQLSFHVELSDIHGTIQRVTHATRANVVTERTRKLR